MAENGLHEEFAAFLAEWLKNLRTKHFIFIIKKVELYGNGIAVDGMAAVNKELHKNEL